MTTFSASENEAASVLSQYNNNNSAVLFSENLDGWSLRAWTATIVLVRVTVRETTAWTSA
jgi:hypothetical protein